MNEYLRENVIKGNMEVVHKDNIGLKDDEGLTSLLLAARYGHLKIVKFCLKNGARVGEEDNDCRTPLLWAAYSGNFHVMKWLLEKGGANIHDMDKEGNIVMSIAVSGGDLEAVKFLVRGKFVLDGELDSAISYKQVETLKWLLDEGDFRLSRGDWTFLAWKGCQSLIIYNAQKTSELFRTILLKHSPPKDFSSRVRKQHVQLIEVACKRGAYLRQNLPTWLQERYDVINLSLKILPRSLVSLLLSFSTPSIDEIWECGPSEKFSKKRKTLL